MCRSKGDGNLILGYKASLAHVNDRLHFLRRAHRILGCCCTAVSLPPDQRRSFRFMIMLCCCCGPIKHVSESAISSVSSLSRKNSSSQPLRDRKSSDPNMVFSTQRTELFTLMTATTPASSFPSDQRRDAHVVAAAHLGCSRSPRDFFS